MHKITYIFFYIFIMEEKIQNKNEEEINFIPLIVLNKNIEITDDGIEYLKSFNNKVIKI